MEGIQAQDIRYLWSNLTVFIVYKRTWDVGTLFRKQNSNGLSTVQQQNNELSISVFPEPNTVHGVIWVSKRCVQNWI